MVHQGSLRRIFKKSSARDGRKAARIGASSGTLSAATSYYLPEGRYYEAPLIVKKAPRASKRVLLSTVVGAGLALAHVSSLQPPHVGSFIAANTTVAVRDDKKDGRQKIALQKRRADLMVADYARHHPSLGTLTMQLETKPQHVAQLMRPDGYSNPALDETQWMVALAPLAPIVQQWTENLTSHFEKVTHFMAAATPVAQENLQPVLVAQADILPEIKNVPLTEAAPEIQVQAMVKIREIAPPIMQGTALAHTESATSFVPAFVQRQERGQEPARVNAPIRQEAATIEVAKIPQLPAIKVPVPKQKELPVLPVPHLLASLVTNDKPDILALGYAPTMQGRGETPFDSILTGSDKNQGRFIPPIGVKDHAWAANPLPPAAFTQKEQKCLAEAIYFESRGEKLKGQAAVAQVVLNRVRNPAYPTTICGVVYQNSSWRNRCQFSFACDGRKRKVTDMKHWQTAQDVAKAVTAGQIWLPEVGSSTHYHAVYVRPKWARTMYKLEKIGLHIFYRTKGGGWS